MFANFFTKKVMNEFVHDDEQESAYGLRKAFKGDCSGQTLLLETSHLPENGTITNSTAGCEITDSILEDLTDGIDILEEVDDMDTLEEPDRLDTLEIGGISKGQATQYEKHSGQTTDARVTELVTMFSAQFQLSSKHVTEKPQACITNKENDVDERYLDTSTDTKRWSELLLEASHKAPHSSSPTLCISTSKLRSALRGGHLKAGLGPRPKLNVKWAPDVYEPLCTSTSHTVPPQSHGHRKQYHQKSSSSKVLQKGKSNRSNSNKKGEKKLSRKLRHGQNESHVLRLPAYVSQLGTRGGYLYPLSKALDGHVDGPALKPVTLNPLVLPQKGWPLSQVLQLHDPKLVARVPPWPIQAQSFCA